MSLKQIIAKCLTNSLIANSKQRRKQLIKIFNYLPDNLKCFTHKTVVTFSMTTEETNVSHSKFAELFGIVRELYGLNQIPNFKKELGKLYMLKTRSASYHYINDFYFGDTIISKMFVASVSPLGYKLVCFFLKEGELHAIGEQEIVHTNMNGIPTKMPDNMMLAYEMVSVNLTS